jgi:predicted Zn-dependent protease
MRKLSFLHGGLLAVLLCGTVPAVAADTPAATKPCSQASDKMDDVYCIGDRRVAHRSIISQNREIAIGQEYAKQIDKESKLIKDPVVTEFVNRVAQNIAQNSDAKIPITVKVIDSPSINAFALPGGFLYVDTGLIKAAGSEAQLAGVLAHEIAHVAANHWGSQATKRDLLQYAMIPLIFTPMSYPVYLGISEGLNFGIPLAFLKFSRADEQQADFLGLQYMWKAGYDPRSYLAMFANIMQHERSDPQSVPSVFMDHPPTKDRIIKAQEEIQTILPQRQQYLVSTSEFQNVQERLNSLLGRMKRNQGGKNQPTLMKQPNSQKKTPSGKSPENDKPPVLRRSGG